MAQRKDASVSELDEIKLSYFEILDGYSFDGPSSLYIKHFSDKESALILRKRIELFHYYSKEGVPHESELLKNALENGEWTREKEDEILSYKYQISDNEKNLGGYIYQQRVMIEKTLDETRAKLSEMTFERKHVLGRSIEDLIDDDVSDYVIYLSFFKDEQLTKYLEPNYEEFQEWEPSKINELNVHLNKNYKRFSEDNLKKVSCLPMFMNKLAFSKEDASTFFRKPINDLTHHQNFIISYGIRNLNILPYAEGHPPDLNLNFTITDVMKWYEMQNSIAISKRNNPETHSNNSVITRRSF